jgi:hypothetical protein
MSDMLAASGMEIGIAEAAIATLATVLTIGVAFLRTPSAATLYWSCGFALAMVATYGVVAGQWNEAELLRRVSLGALLGAPGLLWSGFRAYWGLRPHGWVGIVTSVVAVAALVVTPSQAWFTLAFRVMFLIASLFPMLFFVDWLRSTDRRSDRLLLPLAIVSAVFFMVGATTFVSALLFPPSGGDDFALLRIITTIGMLVYVACAVVAIVGLSTRDDGLVRTTAASSEYQRFQATASDRLRRAQATQHPWSVICLRLDDATDLRQTAGSTAFAALSAALDGKVRSVFPPECDIGSPAPGTIFVVVPGSDAAVREHLRRMLERASRLDISSALPIQPTVSAGWASTSNLGYEFEALVYMSREAATLASEKGGDRWERVGATVVRRLINP